MKSDVYRRAFEFACAVVQIERATRSDRNVNHEAMTQLADAAMSIGSNLEEAKGGQSRADFHAKLRIALKEARESHYWLRLIDRTAMLPHPQLEPLIDEANQSVAILTTIARKTNPKNPRP
jgi:four helix bundle protein